MSNITVQAVCDWLNEIAPFDTAEGYDNVGLLMGDPAAPVSKVLFCLDATPEAVGEAVEIGAQLLITHHPLMFGGVRRIDYTQPEGRVLCAMAGARLNLIAAHTNLDKAPGGTGDALIQALGFHGLRPVNEFVRMGALEAPMTGDGLQRFVGERLQADVGRYGEAAGLITQVAVGPGACGEFAEEALRAGAQAFVVGEIKHHEVLAACAQGMVVLAAGHYATEMIGLKALFARFQATADLAGWPVQPMLFQKPPFLGALRAK